MTRLGMTINRLVNTTVSFAHCLVRRRGVLVLVAVGFAALLASEAWARVGGGGSYGSGGGGGGGGSAGALIYLLFQILRLLVWLTIEYPYIGIPLDILLVGALFWWLFIRKEKSAPSITVSNTAGVAAARLNVDQAWARLRRFDPNFSEIIFTDFCYALYARAQ